MDSLAVAETTSLKEILATAGNRYRMHDPKTWPIQAGLTASERWDNLLQYQKILKGGK